MSKGLSVSQAPPVLEKTAASPPPSPSDHPDAVAAESDSTARAEAVRLGTWLFLASEVMLFGALLGGFIFSRLAHPVAFAHAHTLMNPWLGTCATVVILASAFTMVLAVRAAVLGQRANAGTLLLATAGLAAVFLALQGYEWHQKWSLGLLPGRYFTAVAPPDVRVFFGLFFMMTALHAIHLLVGLGLLSWLMDLNVRGRLERQSAYPMECVGLYLQLLTILWFFMFPLLYLVR